MKKRLIYWLRWFLAVPASLIIGNLVNLLLLSFSSIFINSDTEDVIFTILDGLLFPFVLGFVFIQIGSKIAPKYNKKTAIILLGILLILEIGIDLISPASERISPIIKTMTLLIGGIVGLFFVINHSNKKKH